MCHDISRYAGYGTGSGFRRVGAERVALADCSGSPEAQHASPLPSPNPPCQFAGNGLSRSQPSSPKITLELVTFARFHSSALRLVRNSSNLLLPFYWKDVDFLASFATYLAFPSSNYYDASDAHPGL